MLLKKQDVTVEIALKLKPLLERNGFEVEDEPKQLKGHGSGGPKRQSCRQIQRRQQLGR